MKILYILLFIDILALSNLNARSGWYQQISNFSNNLTSVLFLNVNTGLCAGSYGKILKTTNGGERWDSLNSNSVNHLSSICAIDENIYLACGYGRKVLKTTNAGPQLAQNFIWKFYISDLSFINDSVGYCVGGNGTIIKTVNSGLNWNLQNSNTVNHLSGIYFIN